MWLKMTEKYNLLFGLHYGDNFPEEVGAMLKTSGEYV